MVLDLSSFAKTIAALEESLAIYSKYKETDEKHERALKRGAIQAFVTSYEMARKMFIRYLKEYYDENFDQMPIRDIFRYGQKVGILSDAEKWFTYKSNRDKSSYTYDLSIAEQVFSTTNDFLQEAKYALKQMEQRTK